MDVDFDTELRIASMSYHTFGNSASQLRRLLPTTQTGLLVPPEDEWFIVLSTDPRGLYLAAITNTGCLRLYDLRSNIMVWALPLIRNSRDQAWLAVWWLHDCILAVADTFLVIINPVTEKCAVAAEYPKMASIELVGNGHGHFLTALGIPADGEVPRILRFRLTLGDDFDLIALTEDVESGPRIDFSTLSCDRRCKWQASVVAAKEADALPTHACATLQGQKSSSKVSIRLFAVGLNLDGKTETLAKAHMVPAYGSVERVACLGTQAQDGQSAWLVLVQQVEVISVFQAVPVASRVSPASPASDYGSDADTYEWTLELVQELRDSLESMCWTGFDPLPKPPGSGQPGWLLLCAGHSRGGQGTLQVIDLLRNGMKPSGAGRRSCANADDCLYKWNTSKLNTPLVRVQWVPSRGGSMFLGLLAEGCVLVWTAAPQNNWFAFVPNFYATGVNCDWIEGEEAFDFNGVADDGHRTKMNARHTINLYKQSSKVDFAHWLDHVEVDKEGIVSPGEECRDVRMRERDGTATKLLAFMQPDYPLLDEASSKRQHVTKKAEAAPPEEYSEAVRAPSFSETGEVRVISPEAMEAVKSCSAAW
ncbi:hypothetical protein FOZ63_017510 [Perkinsus olseni]|uniref:Uncharacterized protein n=1 Tax=Perkinsus olseni TaxID=32597 RepID=A0A7J6PV67_PEROL|nr:hypothetical protein FOZ63_017510 [Perkinsus olseni]